MLTGGDLPRIPWLEGEPLFGPAVHYRGQPLAAVVADTEAIARRGVRGRGARPETEFRVTAAARRDGTLEALDVEASVAMD